MMGLRPIIIDQDGVILGGNMRFEAIRALGMKEIPDEWVKRADDLTEEQKQEFIIKDNVGFGEWDWDVLANEWDEVKLGEWGLDVPVFAASDPIEEEEKGLHAEEEILIPYNGIYQLREDVNFPSSNRWGIPDLRPDMLSTQFPTETWYGQPQFEAGANLFIYGKMAFPLSAAGGTLAFYTDDYKFEVVWSDAVKIVERFISFGWGAVVAPDFSVWRDDPCVIQLYNIYRSRWIARYWQEAGLRIIPSLNWSDEHSYEFCNLGIPKNSPVVACQAQTTRSAKGKQFFLQGLVRAIADIEPQTVVIYGGRDHREWVEPELPEGIAYVFLPSWSSARREHLDSLKKGGAS